MCNADHVSAEDVSGASVKTDRAMSPNTMSEEDRRELIARQHRALYGDNSTLYNADGTAARPGSQDARVPAGARGASPMAFDPFSAQAQAAANGVGAIPATGLHVAREPVSTLHQVVRRALDFLELKSKGVALSLLRHG